jgi:hypothetical protein
MARHAAQDEEIRQDVDHIDRLQLSRDPDRQALMGELVDNVEHPELLSVMGAVLDEVVGPDVIAVFRPQPDARPIGEPEAAALRLSGGDLQPFTAPDSFDPLVIDLPPRPAQELCDLAIAVAPVLSRQGDHVGGQLLLVFRAPRHLALRRAMLPERRTSTTLGHVQHRPHMVDHCTPARGA